jgi:LAO/AO transport system kinase
LAAKVFDIEEMSGRIVNGDRLAVARAMTFIENEHPNYIELLDTLHPFTGRAYRLGITGPPGAGKSTFTNQLAKILRREDKKVGIVAVDPTSPFSGGAILGDRVRMNDLSLDNGIFIRSVATRGSLGGLARQATELADVLDAAGYDYIIYETVGVGQVEIDIAEAADSTIVLVIPEGGDIIQGMKAGLMEIGDIFVLNKSDRPGADRMQQDLEYVLHLQETRIKWHPNVLPTVAHTGKGIEAVRQEIAKHLDFLQSENLLNKKRNKRLRNRIGMIISQELENAFWGQARRDRLKVFAKHVKNGSSVSAVRRPVMPNLSPLRVSRWNLWVHRICLPVLITNGIWVSPEVTRTRAESIPICTVAKCGPCASLPDSVRRKIPINAITTCFHKGRVVYPSPSIYRR